MATSDEDDRTGERAPVAWLAQRLFAAIGQIHLDAAVPFDPAWFPLFRLLEGDGSVRLSGLGRTLGVGDAAARRMVARLEDLDLVAVRASADDRRARAVSLTKAGRAIQRQIHGLGDLLRELIPATARRPEEALALLEAFERPPAPADDAARGAADPDVAPVAAAELPQAAASLAEGEALPLLLEGPQKRAPRLAAWALRREGKLQGLLAVASRGTEDRIVLLRFDGWRLDVARRLLAAWGRERGARRSLAVRLPLNDKLWIDRLDNCGFAAQSITFRVGGLRQLKMRWLPFGGNGYGSRE